MGNIWTILFQIKDKSIKACLVVSTTKYWVNFRHEYNSVWQPLSKIWQKSRFVIDLCNILFVSIEKTFYLTLDCDKFVTDPKFLSRIVLWDNESVYVIQICKFDFVINFLIYLLYVESRIYFWNCVSTFYIASGL